MCSNAANVEAEKQSARKRVNPAKNIEDDQQNKTGFVSAFESSTSDCETLKTAAPELSPSPPSNWLKSQTEMPAWSRYSAILSDYRPIRPSLLYCLSTVLLLHNESGNIWTHGAGALFFVHLYCSKHLGVDGQMTHTDHLMLSLFFVGVIICLSLSAIFHTMSCHSQEAVRFFSKLDYCGISLLISCSFVPWIYYAFYNSPIIRACYIFLSLFFGLACILASLLTEDFCERHYRKFRAALFSGDGLSGVVPVLHWAVRESLACRGHFLQLDHRPAILLLIMGVTYITGGLLYAFKIPERFAPGRFDRWAHSHQLFHVLVVLAAILYYHSLTQLIQLRLRDPHHFYN